MRAIWVCIVMSALISVACAEKFGDPVKYWNECENRGETTVNCNTTREGYEVLEASECVPNAADDSYNDLSIKWTYCSGRCGENCVEESCSGMQSECTDDGLAKNCIQSVDSDPRYVYATLDCNALGKQCIVKGSTAVCE